MSDDYLWDRSGEPDPEIERLERALAPLGHDAPWREPSKAAPEERGPSPAPVVPLPIVPLVVRKPQRVFHRSAWALGGALALAACSVLWLQLRAPGAPSGAPIAGPVAISGPAASASGASPAPVDVCTSQSAGFPFTAKGSVMCGGVLAQAGNLPSSVWMETGDGATAEVKVADIGTVTLRSSSRLRIVATTEKEHRLELVAGSLHAKVKAPPRLFVIDTRAATAVDLGCEYDLSIDEMSRSILRVRSGAVSLEGKGKMAYVPAGTGISADPDRGPGVVIADGATPAFADAAERFEAGDASALVELLAQATAQDVFTLWNILPGAPADVREKVVRRLEELRLVPAKIGRQALTSGDKEATLSLRKSLESSWFER